MCHMEKKNVINDYEDIIKLPHHTSPKRPHMSVLDRAAQFSPFAALTGYDAAVKEAARLTERRIELDEYEKAALDRQIQIICEHIKEQPEITVMYFLADEQKTGGSYQTARNCIKKIDLYERMLVMKDGIKIPIQEIVELRSTLFHSSE